VGAARRALQHYQFLRESLRDLAQQLRSCGAAATGRGRSARGAGPAARPAALARLYRTRKPATATYARDLAVARWCRRQGVAWQEWPQHGVVRRLPSREQWHGLWQAHMQAPACRRRCRPACDPLPWPDTWPAPEPWAC
jgi:deoxyribodipyrimidine photo-lyase